MGGTQNGASITLALGQSATCTITNDDQPAQLTLVKQVINSHGGTAVATDFLLSAAGTPLVNVAGGGPSGQAGAVRHGIARALLVADATLRPTLKAQGLLTRDPRMKERKKYGQPGARKRFQYSKR